MTLVSPHNVYASRPRFEIDGTDQERLSTDLLDLEVSIDEEGMARLEARFLNHGQAEPGADADFLHFNGVALGLGRAISVRAGDEENEAEIFRGLLTAIEADYPQQRPPEISICAEDALQGFRMVQRTRTFREQTDTEIASALASDHSLSPDADVSGPSHTELWQVNQSDLAFLRERARAVDARLAIESGRLVFRPRRDPARSETMHVLRWQNELLRFRVTADLAHQRTEVRVHGYSVADKEGIHVEATGSDIESEADGGRTGPSILDSLGMRAVEDHPLEMPSTTDEAQGIADAMARRRARRFVCGEGMTMGTPALQVGHQVELQDLGPWFSGRYHVAAIRHCFDLAEGLRTHFTAERVDLGGHS